MADDFVSKALANAKKALADSDKSNVAPKASPYAPPKHEHADADYSVAHAASKAPSTGDELKAKSDNVDQYVKSQQ
jgi:hypothetical protein